MKYLYFTLISNLLIVLTLNYVLTDDITTLNDDIPKTTAKPSGSGGSRKCGLFEKFKKCGCDCRELCQNRHNISSCPPIAKSYKCFCINGFFRKDGKCVPEDQCDGLHQKGLTDFADNAALDRSKNTTCTAVNQEFNDCGSKCMESCDAMDSPTLCVTFGPNRCDAPGCYCKEGYYKNENNTCVSEEKCEHDLDLDTRPPFLTTEFTTEMSTESGAPIDRTPDTTTLSENEEAAAKEREKTDTSPLVVTTPTHCSDNEVYSECGNRCMESLENKNNNSKCDIKWCDIGCFCKPNFFRNEEGLCVEEKPTEKDDDDDDDDDKDDDYDGNCEATTPTTETCEVDTPTPESCEVESFGLPIGTICPQNEMYKECGSKCMEKIETLTEQLGCDNSCESGCFCESGLYRNRNGFCVQPPPLCPHNEKYSDCGNRCMESIQNIYVKKRCNQDKCDIGCFCIPGYFRDVDGKCIEKPRICPTGEAYSDCGNRCLELLKNKLLNKRKICNNKHCDVGCFCLPDKFRNNLQECVEPPPPCADDEEYVECSNRCIESIQDIKHSKACPRNCEPGCYCKRGMYRTEVGVCRPRCPMGEMYSDCGNRCMESIKNFYNPNQCDKSHCDSGCFCEPDSFRTSVGQCIKPPRPQCGENEEFEACGNRCVESMATIDNPDVCESGKHKCESGCFCKDGYFRDNSGICLIPQKCADKPKCPLNEMYSDCGNRCMESLENKRNDVECDQSLCDVGCFCLPPMFRNNEGLCVEIQAPTEKPQECKLDEEMTECGNRCLEALENKEQQWVCPLDLCEFGCFCKNGLYRNKKGKCVPHICPEEEHVCKSGEKWSQCDSRCREMCVNREQSYVCDLNRCDVGCFCEEGLYRDDEGFCVPAHACEATTDCPPAAKPICPNSEVYRECANRCPEYCVNSEDPNVCPPNECESGCFCKRGTFRNDRGVCVPQSQCFKSVLTPKPQLICGRNEIYKSCAVRCVEYCPGQLPENEKCSGSASCEFGCFCDKGFKRNSEDECVPENQCQKPTESDHNSPITEPTQDTTVSEKHDQYCGQKNEEFNECGTECGKTCADYQSADKCDENLCKPGCFCHKGYVRSVNGMCVLPEDCKSSQSADGS
ncbi:zonadhesin-like [Oppia nitens]|uniref:zonadhesin-like n=1 Tax=Oppia nitens TaxID=1686743 RepID=UPI0023DAB008|nr:zonadhesin-like [Oppia nitens]